MSTTEPTRCAGRLIYRRSHAIADRWYVVYPPNGGQVSCCSIECLLEWICEPPTSLPEPARFAPLLRAPDQRRRRHLAVVR